MDTKQIKDGTEALVVTGNGRRYIATVYHCKCGSLYVVNAVTLVCGLPHLPMVKMDRLNEIWTISEDGKHYNCEACS
jgi:hypothetical protein